MYGLCMDCALYNKLIMYALCRSKPPFAPQLAYPKSPKRAPELLWAEIGHSPKSMNNPSIIHAQYMPNPYMNHV